MLDLSKSVRDILLRKFWVNRCYLLLFVVKIVWVTILGGGLYKGLHRAASKHPCEGIN